MLFGLFTKKPQPVKVRREINFKIDNKTSQKDAEKQLNKIVRDIEDKTGLKVTIKKTYTSFIGGYLNGKACRSLVAVVAFDTMTTGKEKIEDAQNRINYDLNDIDENTRKFNIVYME